MKRVSNKTYLSERSIGDGSTDARRAYLERERTARVRAHALLTEGVEQAVAAIKRRQRLDGYMFEGPNFKGLYIAKRRDMNYREWLNRAVMELIETDAETEVTVAPRGGYVLVKVSGERGE